MHLGCVSALSEPELRDAIEATCGEDGYTGDTYCPDCGVMLSEGEAIPATGDHSWDDGVEVREPSAAYDEHYNVVITLGELLQTCEVCGETLTTPIKATPELRSIGEGEARCSLEMYYILLEMENGAEYMSDSFMSPSDWFDSYVDEKYIPAELSWVYDYSDVKLSDIQIGDVFTVHVKPDDADSIKEIDVTIAVTHSHEGTPEEPRFCFDNGEVTTEATCISAGVMTYTCKVCGETETEDIEIDPDNHASEPELRDAVEATCGEDGYTGDTYCPDCGVKLTEGEAIPATGEHEWDEGVVISEASVQYGEEEGIVVTPGELLKTCGVCGETLSTPIKAVPKLKTEVSGRNKLEMYFVLEAIRNGAEYLSDSEMSPDNYFIAYSGKNVYIDAELSWAKDYSNVKLSDIRLGDKFTVHVKPENPDIAEADIRITIIHDHDYAWFCFDDGVITKPGTCISKAEKTYTCTVCGETYTKETDPDYWNHVSEPELRNAVEANCGVAGYTGDTYCPDCGEMLTEGEDIPATGDHSYDDGVVFSKPSAEYIWDGTAISITAGAMLHTCVVCGDTYTTPIKAVPELRSYPDESNCCGLEMYCVLDAIEYAENLRASIMDPSKFFSAYIDGKRTNPTLSWTDDCIDTKLTDIRIGDTLTLYVYYGLDEVVEDVYVTVPVFHNHNSKAYDFFESEVTEEGTCVSEGTRTYTCVVCGETYTEAVEINPDNHASEPERRNAVKATCTTDGYTGDRVCPDCGTVISTGETVSATGHSWTAGDVITAATCASEGTRSLVCSACGETSSESIPKDEDNHKGPIVTCNAEAAGCVTDGYTGDRFCEACDALIEEGTVIKAVGKHTEDSGTVTTSPAVVLNSKTGEYEVKTGIKTFTCQVCGNERTKTVKYSPKLGGESGSTALELGCLMYLDAERLSEVSPDWFFWAYAGDSVFADNAVNVDAELTWAEDYSSVRIADIGSGDKFTVKITPADTSVFAKREVTIKVTHNHSEFPVWDYGEVTKPAACKSTGTILYTCEVCGKTKTEDLPFDATNHLNTVIDPAVPPTATSTGLTRGIHCGDCGAVLVEQEEIPIPDDVGYTIKYYAQCYARPQESETFEEYAQRISEQYGYPASYIRSITDDFGDTYYLYYKPDGSEAKTGFPGSTPVIAEVADLDEWSEEDGYKLSSRGSTSPIASDGSTVVKVFFDLITCKLIMVNGSSQTERSGLYGQRMALENPGDSCFAGWSTSASSDGDLVSSVVLYSKTVIVYAEYNRMS